MAFLGCLTETHGVQGGAVQVLATGRLRVMWADLRPHTAKVQRLLLCRVEKLWGKSEVIAVH